MDQEPSPSENKTIKYQIDDVSTLWNLIKDGTQNLKSQSRGFVKVGPNVGNVGNEPEIRFVKDRLVFKIEITKPSGGNFYGDFPIDLLKEEVATLPGFSSDGVNVYKNGGNKRNRIAYNGSGGEFFFETQKDEILNEDQLKEKLEEASKLFGIFAKVQYQKEGYELPDDELIISPEVLIEMEEISDYGRKETSKALNSIEHMIIRQKPDVSFEDIGGQSKAVETCKRLSEQLRFPEVYALQGSEPPRGILLFGPQGTGKTMLAKAIANSSDANFLFVQAGDVVGEGLYGQTEMVVTQLFDEAKRLAETDKKQVIIFVDEADLILPQPSGGGVNRHEATGKVVGIFAQQMDGVMSSNKITTILATNNPERLDPKILSRMDEREEVPLPDFIGIKEILHIQLRAIEEKFNIKVAREGIDFDKVCKIAAEQSLSGRDIRDILGNLNRKRGQIQLTKILNAIDTEQISLPENINKDLVVKQLAERLKSGDVDGIQYLQLEPISEEELIDSFKTGKALIERKRGKKLGFVPDTN